ncbi:MULTISPECIES: hypothetical protein [Nostoc]|uniref:Uncharacterized protein n=1 Tax=Nostoc paludosum FACHB-159 TaxID=2692908 RepID=A0ABR8KCZ9_9NOSO|nr:MULTISPECIES: hypothetical protein [Nostoc]MBD2680944.1 hypothetical protein [Nostoc sp. FACHB-857]MBD2737420.1 hypothetical protein [Nostoc paludosum FACHB-159]
MSDDYSTVSATLHLNIEQSYDLLLEQSTATGSINRIQVSAWRKVSVTACRVYREEKSCIPPLLHES